MFGVKVIGLFTKSFVSKSTIQLVQRIQLIQLVQLFANPWVFLAWRSTTAPVVPGTRFRLPACTRNARTAHGPAEICQVRRVKRVKVGQFSWKCLECRWMMKNASWLLRFKNVHMQQQNGMKMYEGWEWALGHNIQLRVFVCSSLGVQILLAGSPLTCERQCAAVST